MYVKLYLNIVYLILCLAIVFIPIVVSANDNKSEIIENYQYKTVVFLGANDNGKTNIFFNEYEQDGNIVTINGYAVNKIHWLDFDTVDEHSNTLKVVLTDNGNRFEYTVIKTGEIVNQNNYAIQ